MKSLKNRAYTKVMITVVYAEFAKSYRDHPRTVFRSYDGAVITSSRSVSREGARYRPRRRMVPD
jgi:hypothetical protein